MPLRSVATALVFVLASGTAGAAVDLLSYAIAADGSVARIEYSNVHALVLGSGDSERRLVLPEIDAVHDIVRRPVVSWSRNGAHLAIEYRVAERRSEVLILDATTLDRLQSVHAVAFAWTEWPGELVYVPAYDPDTGPVHPGMARLEVVNGEHHALGQGFYFTGPLQVSGDWVLAHTAPLEQQVERHCLAKVHLHTGVATELACEK